MKTHLVRSDFARILLGCAAVLAGALPSSAATILDLTTAGVVRTGTSINPATGLPGANFIVQQVDPQSTGTGVLNPFLRLQHNGSEQAFNTDAGPQPPLDAVGGIWTHTLQLSAVPVVNFQGNQYRQFALDINQSRGGNNELLSLNQIQFFQSFVDVALLNWTVTAATATNPSQLVAPGATEVFRMNNASAALNNEILLNFVLDPGSGAGDMRLYVPNSLFNTNVPLLTLYSQFGAPPGGSSTNDGFEEWAIVGAPSVPDGGSTIALLGGALVLLAAYSRRGSLLGA